MSTRQISLAIRGMFCASCALNIERALGQLDGVVTARVNYATERATVIYDPARVIPMQFVKTLRDLHFDTPLDHRTISSDDLLYATSPRTVEKAVRSAEGVVGASVCLAARQVDVDLLPGNRNNNAPQRSLMGLGLRIDEGNTSNALFAFALRVAIVTAIWILTLWSAGSHAGWLVSPGLLHTPVVVLVLALVLLLSAGLPFYHLAFDAFLQGEFDAGVLTALIAAGLAIGGLPLGAIAPSTAAADIGFVIAATLTMGWFLIRASRVWLLPWLERAADMRQGHSFAHWRNRVIPFAAGVLAASAMLTVYLGTLTALQSTAHAWEQLTADGFWVGLVALGFGGQVGLYAFLRTVVQAAKAGGATAVTGAGTGTSTLGMLACCVHHLGDVAPLVALTGASALSGVAGFLTEWKFAFIGLGVAMNVVGILVTWRTMRTCLARQALKAASTDAQSALACH